MSWYIDEFMCYCQSRQLRPKTMKSYEQSLKLLERWLLVQLKINDEKLVKEQMLRKYINDYLSQLKDLLKQRNIQYDQSLLEE